MTPKNAASLASLKARLDKIPTQVRDGVKPAAVASSDALVTEMKRLCPHDSGDLAESIKAAPGASDTELKVTAGGPRAPYALHVEFGTHKAHAQPFFRPAIRTLRANITQNLKAAAKASIKPGAGK